MQLNKAANGEAFLPFIMEAHGRLGTKALDLLKNLAKMDDNDFADEDNFIYRGPNLETLQRNRLLNHWLALLSVTLQKGNVACFSKYAQWRHSFFSNSSNFRRRADRSFDVVDAGRTRSNRTRFDEQTLESDTHIMQDDNIFSISQ
jgi:hypothetical protein